ncbi:hypothetical protein ACHAWF_016890, partial [Thalassiosira exigua]
SPTFEGEASCTYDRCLKGPIAICEGIRLIVRSTPNPAVATIKDRFTVSSNVTAIELDVLATDSILNADPSLPLFLAEVGGPGRAGEGTCSPGPRDDSRVDLVVVYDPPDPTSQVDVVCTYKACFEVRGERVCEDGSVEIAATSVNNPTVAATYDERTVFLGQTWDLNVTANDASLNPPGRPLVVANIDFNASGGRGNCTADGTGVKFTPAENFIGVATCQYTVSTDDGDVPFVKASAQASVRITVVGAPTQAPTAPPTQPPTAAPTA